MQNNLDIGNNQETKKIQTLFCLKGKLYSLCKIYYGVCECRDNYISKTKRNPLKSWLEPDIPTKDYKTARHLSKHINHVFI